MSYQRRPTVEESPLQGDLMLFDPERNQFFVLNRSMAHVWRCCDGRHSLDRMVETAAGAFSGAEPATLQTDFSAALEQLVQLGLALPVNASSAAETREEAVP